jgi:hypothetical protein
LSVRKGSEPEIRSLGDCLAQAKVTSPALHRTTTSRSPRGQASKVG